MKPGVYITFDVECSMGGAWENPQLKPVPPDRAVWGRYGGSELGIGLITDILQQHGLSATFFLEAFMAEQGYPDAAEPICKFLLDRNQDVQLHIHPWYKNFWLNQQDKPFHETDQFTDLPAAEQLDLIADGCERIKRWTGRPAVAFRAGNMGASEETLGHLSDAGITIDSSYTFCYVGGQCRFKWAEPFNGSRWFGDVLELSLSGFRQARLPGLRPAKPLDLMGISFEECRDAIRKICGAGADAVVILHSFSLFKVRDAQYDGGRPNRIVTRRLRRLCKWLAEHHDDLPTRTFRDLAATIRQGRYIAHAVPPCKITGVRPIVRKAVQVYNNPYWT